MSAESLAKSINNWVNLIDVIMLLVGYGFIVWSLFLEPAFNGHQWLVSMTGLLLVLVGGQKR